MGSDRDASGTPAQGKGAQTRQTILQAAIARFGRDGYRSTSVADIAREASVGGSLVYAYFPNKEALFLAAVDEDAAAVINEGLSSALTDLHVAQWRQTLITTLVVALESHPLARRLLAGLEPEVTDRVLEIPALAELRKVSAERIRAEQISGFVRPDVDPTTMANGIVAITLSLLMSVVQMGDASAALYGSDIAAVLTAALSWNPPPKPES